MDIHTQALELALDLPIIRDWPELQGLVRRSALSNVAIWKLPMLACEAVGGTSEQAIPAAAALACLHISIILIDDLLDADPRGEYQTVGAPAAANFTVALQAAGLAAILRDEIEPPAQLATLNSFNQMMLTIALGQHLDTQNPSDEASYWRVVQSKSSPFFGAALYSGAVLGGARWETAEGLRQVGNLYGEMIQIHDDMKDTMAMPANADWILGRSPLPILFAQIVEHPDRERFLLLRRTVSKPETLAEAQDILIRCGAISYCVNHLILRYHLAQERLRELPLNNHLGLENLLEDQISPVRELLAAVEPA